MDKDTEVRLRQFKQYLEDSLKLALKYLEKAKNAQEREPRSSIHFEIHQIKDKFENIFPNIKTGE